MLSLSADLSETSVDLEMVTGEEADSDGGVEHGEALAKFAEAIAKREEDSLIETRDALVQEAGPEVMVDAAAVAANFQRMVRIADSTGIPLDDRSLALSAGVRKQLDLGEYASAQHTPAPTLKSRLLSLIAMPMAKRILRKQSKG